MMLRHRTNAKSLQRIVRVCSNYIPVPYAGPNYAMPEGRNGKVDADPYG